MIAKIIVMEKYFWEHHVLAGAEPVPDGSEATTRYFNEKFSISNGKTIELPEEVLPVCEEYESLTKQIRELETAKNAAANQLKSYLGEAESGTVGDRKITWKSINKSSLDTKRLKTEQPQIYTDYLTQSSYRRLSVA